MTTINKTKKNERNRLAIAGVQKHFTSPVVVGGVTRQPNDMVATFQGAIDATAATATAEEAFHTAVEKEQTAAVAADALYEDLEKTVLNQFKGQAGPIGDFGMVEKVRKPMSAATKAEAAAKRKATAAAKKAAKAAAAAPAPATPANPTKS
jgi:type I site-specific restriction endonuclease